MNFNIPLFFSACGKPDKCFVVTYNTENLFMDVYGGLKIQMTTCRHFIVLTFFVRINVQKQSLFVTKQNILG